jgi:uncharacterized protein (TIGR02246 family)
MADHSMAKPIALPFVALALTLIFAAAAHADPAATAQRVNDAFVKATEACDVPAILDLYEDNAVVIWPGQDEYAIGKPAFRKVLEHYCGGGVKQSFKVVSSGARQAGPNYIIHFGQLDVTARSADGKSSTLRVRTDELLHKSGGKWRYVVDHASVGLPPPPSAKAGASTHD